MPPGLAALRYGLEIIGSDGESLRLSGSLTSTALITDMGVPDFNWQEVRDGNLSLFYLPNTPAARDIEALRAASAASLGRDTEVLGGALSQPLAVYLLPRIFWQGGAAYGDRTIMISYADRDYTGVGPRDYLTHELAHVLSQSWGNLTNAGGVLSEGLAVYATGGHYQPDRLDRSAATLVQSPLFIPPALLRRDFSNLQHEVAYTESGSFVKFLVDEFGLDKLRALFRRPNDWQTIYGDSADGLSQRWLDKLRVMPVDDLDTQRWRLKARFFDVMRAYEQRIDPDARRLPTVPVARWDAGLRSALGSPAEGEENQVLELLLGAIVNNIESAPDASHLTAASNMLDEVERRTAQSSDEDGPTVAAARSMVRLAHAQSSALLERDWPSLRATLDESGHPLFASQLVTQAQAQPAWLRMSLTPVRLVMSGADQAFITVAQWAEPLDPTAPVPVNDGRWVLSMQNTPLGWRVTGRWPESPEVITAR